MKRKKFLNKKIDFMLDEFDENEKSKTRGVVVMISLVGPGFWGLSFLLSPSSHLI